MKCMKYISYIHTGFGYKKMVGKGIQIKSKAYVRKLEAGNYIRKNLLV